MGRDDAPAWFETAVKPHAVVVERVTVNHRPGDALPRRLGRRRDRERSRSPGGLRQTYFRLARFQGETGVRQTFEGPRRLTIRASDGSFVRAELQPQDKLPIRSSPVLGGLHHDYRRAT